MILDHGPLRRAEDLIVVPKCSEGCGSFAEGFIDLCLEVRKVSIDVDSKA